MSSEPSLEYPFAEAPEPISPREVLPGLYWVRMPLPPFPCATRRSCMAVPTA